MNAIDFCFWLQGFFEISDDISSDPPLTEKQIEVIRNHLNLVFKHEIDPLREGETPATPDELNTAHNGKPSFGPDTIMRC